MQAYYCEIPAHLQHTEKEAIICDEQQVGTIQRVYSNGLKKVIDRMFDQKYFVQIDTKIEGFAPVTCKKIQRKGKIYYDAIEEGQPLYRIAYIGWKELIPDLMISNKKEQMTLEMNREGWSPFLYNEKTIARWRADYIEEKDTFRITFEMLEDSSFQNPALFLSIAQAALFIGA
ncbi:hypothetical protein WDR10_07725 [Kurthia gibsonii]|uniref:tubby C-terminal domain-like protein n=1 Tax=Kurthia gibsonii TaxID=33946 RepID=UPI0030D4976F